MKRKTNSEDWDWELKPRKLEKGTNKAGKHRKSIYNMLSDYDEDDYFDEEFDSDVNVNNNRRYVKR